jgi:hypothetical protein
VWEALVQDESRIKVIVADLLSCAASGLSPARAGGPQGLLGTAAVGVYCVTGGANSDCFWRLKSHLR